MAKQTSTFSPMRTLNFVKSLPYLVMARPFLVLSVFFIIGGLLYLLLFSTSFFSNETITRWVFSFNVLSFFFCASVMFLMDRRYQREMHWRAMAKTRHPDALLAQTQPLPRTDALSLPYVISWEPTWRYRAAMGILLGFIISLVCIGFFFMTLPTISRYIPIYAIGISSILLGSVLGLVLGELWAFKWDMKEQIEVTADELIYTSDWFTRHVTWQEAQIFAMRGETKRQRFPFVLYVVASASVDIKWRRIRRPNKWMQPATSFIDYREDCDDLLALIAAKTGLALYELEP